MKKFRVKFHKEVIVEVPDDLDEYEIIQKAYDEVARGDAYITVDDAKSVIEI